MSDAEAAKRYGKAATWITLVRKRANIPQRPRRWTEKEREVLIANQHLTAREVASLVGRTLGAVSMERSKLIARGLLQPKQEQPWRRATAATTKDQPTAPTSERKQQCPGA